ncbi:STY0301 family protein [Massilia endophytica]|uniref:STY0301 family protein n=1 Tax=Massilia endophytica TaxID=2899220 RepID=UPI001E3DB2DA|nr:STY0301 family protein [Massilia endophytica]UGQ47210.1 hypothetical protein LSQ66_01645 [Massilia endophytica]
MKSTFLIWLMAVSGVCAQVIECPKSYPPLDTELTMIPSTHKGKGLVSARYLSGASMFIGEFNDGGELQGLRKDVKGGYDIEVPADTRWLVCFYGDSQAISWWEELKLEPKSTSCTVQVRSAQPQRPGAVEAKLICK